MGAARIVVVCALAVGCARTYVDSNEELRETCEMLENGVREATFCSTECTDAWLAAEERCAEELVALSAHPEAAAQTHCLERCLKVAECTREIGGDASALDCGCTLECLEARSASYRRLASASTLCWYDEDLRDACF